MIIGERVQVPKYIKTFWDDQCQMMSDKPPVFLLPTLSSTTPISVCRDSPNKNLPNLLAVIWQMPLPKIEKPNVDRVAIPTGAFVCPRSHKLGIGLGFHGSSAPSSTYHSTFRVLNFRDWFGVSCLYCTLQSTLETTCWAFNFRDSFGVSWSTAPFKAR